MVKVSVIVPVYNEELYLEQCLNSVCAQTLQDIEIICIDDGSTDGSSEILACFTQKENRLKLIKQSNKFAGNARNLGMQNAKGKYLCFLDADDFFEPDLLEKMYNAAEKHRSDIVICEAQYFDDKTGEYIKRKVPLEKQFLPSNHGEFNRNDIAERLFQITNGWAWDKLFLASFIQDKRLQFSKGRTANDGFFVYMALALADKITKLDEVLVTQRISNNNSLVNTRDKSWKCGFDMIYDIRTELQERGIYGQLKRSFLNWALKYIVWSYRSMVKWEGKEQIYNYVRESGKVFPILDHPLEFYYYPSEYALYKRITENSFGSYVEEVMFQKETELQRLTEQQERILEILKKKKWQFPFSKVLQHSEIVIYGSGQVGQDYYRQILDSGYCNIVLWMDRKFKDKNCCDQDIFCGWIEELKMVQFNSIVLALSRKKDVEETIELLLEYGVNKQQIVWEI